MKKKKNTVDKTGKGSMRDMGDTVNPEGKLTKTNVSVLTLLGPSELLICLVEQHCPTG